MIRGGFLPAEDRTDLIALARDGSVAHRLGRANALVLLDDGLSCEAVAKLLFVDDDTIRSWRQLYEEDGLEGLTRFEAGGSACQLSGEQQETLKAWVQATLPRTTREVGAWIEKAPFTRAARVRSRFFIAWGSNTTSRMSSLASSTKQSRRRSSRLTKAVESPGLR
jgi:transposase